MSLPIPAPRAQGFTTSTSLPLYWREDGPADAPPVILLHGGPGAQHDYLYPQCLAFAKSHRLFTYDQRGGGQSKSDDRTPVTWQTQVDDLARIITEFDLHPVTLIGYSWGGLLAMLYAIQATEQRAPDVPESLVLISPAPITRTWRNEFEQRLAARQRGPRVTAMRDALNSSGLREQDNVAYRERAFEVSVAGYFAVPERATALTPFRVTGRVQQSIWESLGDFDLQPALRGLSIPTLVIHGEDDPIPLESARAAATALNAQFVVLPDCGHVPYVEQPQALFGSVETFLTKK